MLPLENIKVLDLTHLGPGNFCAMILGDLGAEVVKIQALPGISPRGAGIGVLPDEQGTRKREVHDALNRNKKGLALNLRSEIGHQIFCRLGERADVIVEGFRPGTVARLGIDYKTMREINPGIIYCSLSGYGQTGPYSNLPGHDINYISLGGALSLIGSNKSPPTIPLNLIADFGGAPLHGVIGILAALIARDKTGKGQYVDIAYLDTVISILANFASQYFATGIVIKRGETALHGAYPYYGVYETRDGKYLSIGCLEPWFWENLCRALGKEEYISYHFLPDHRFAKVEDDKMDEIHDWLREAFLTRDRDEWFEYLRKLDVPVGKVHTLDEVFCDPQVLHREMVIELEHPTLGIVKQIGTALKMSETPAKVRNFSPSFGEHTQELLSDLGYTQEEIEELRKIKVIG